MQFGKNYIEFNILCLICVAKDNIWRLKYDGVYIFIIFTIGLHNNVDIKIYTIHKNRKNIRFYLNLQTIWCIVFEHTSFWDVLSLNIMSASVLVNRL